MDEPPKREPFKYDELWGLEIDSDPGTLLNPVDDNPDDDDDGILVYFSRESAENAAKHQLDMLGESFTPRRIVTE